MDLSPIFEPKTMAVFGVSASNYRHPANEIFNKNRHRYPVTVYGINPGREMIDGQKIYHGIADIPEQIDLAIIAVRADLVPAVLSECIKVQMPVPPLSYQEASRKSGRRDLQDRIVAIAREASFPFIGPNCLGIYVPDHVDTFFLPANAWSNLLRETSPL